MSRVKSLLGGFLLIRKTALKLTSASRERAATNAQLLSDVCDITIPVSALGYIDLDDGIVGLAGTTSSLIGLLAAWKKTA